MEEPIQKRANEADLQRRRITIDPITRLEGHGKIEIFLDESGEVDRAYLQVPELRGFEVFSRGRPAEEIPQLTSRICGVCPTAHHMASTKALDDLYQVEPPPAARKVRELFYHSFMLEDHALHVYLLGGPDFIVGPEAQKAYEELFAMLGGRPVHYTLANHWARVVEMVYAAERMNLLVHDPEITGRDLRVIPTETPTVGVGVVEAPRGTLFHHYETDEKGLIRQANLIVATQNNAARIAMSVEKAAKGLIHHGEVSEGLLNRVEMAFRAYDPCLGCATHALPGQMPLVVQIHDASGRVVQEIRR